MNVSMMDSYNLSWKLAYSVLGSTPQIKPMLETYNIERLSVAQQLIYFDRNYSAMFCGNPRTSPGCEVTAMELHASSLRPIGRQIHLLVDVAWTILRVN
jgi:2-polyprenyl-6-methoxyphenol hydroxylase-like FAD-dependent oxidoreductase